MINCNMKVSDRIKAIRKSRGITQVDMSEKMGVGQSNYAYLEDRGDKLTVEQLGRIAGALGVTVGELLTDESQTVQDSERVKELERNLEKCEADRLQLRFYELGREGMHNHIVQEVVKFAFENQFVEIVPNTRPNYEVNYIKDKKAILSDFISAKNYETFFEILRASSLYDEGKLLSKWEGFYKNYVPNPYRTDFMNEQGWQ